MKTWVAVVLSNPIQYMDESNPCPTLDRILLLLSWMTDHSASRVQYIIKIFEYLRIDYFSNSILQTSPNFNYIILTIQIYTWYIERTLLPSNKPSEFGR